MAIDKVMKTGNNKDVAKVLASLTEIKPARLQLNIHPDMHKQFKKVSFNNDEEMSDIVLTAVADYLSKNGVEVSPEWLKKPKDWK